MKTIITLLLSLLVNSGEFNSIHTGRPKKEVPGKAYKNISAAMFLKSVLDHVNKFETTTVTAKTQECNCSCDTSNMKANLTTQNLTETIEQILLPVQNDKKVKNEGNEHKGRVTERAVSKSYTISTITTKPNNEPSYNQTYNVQPLQLHLDQTEEKPNGSINQICPRYKEVLTQDIDKMVDEWKLTYYKASAELNCFKIILSKTTSEELDQYENNFSNFNNTIAWKQCKLELAPSRPSKGSIRKHFLQTSNSSKSVFNNVIITLKHNKENDSTTITLNEQNPDQWYVTDFLLLMKDCDNGDVLIFTRVPTCQNKGTCLLSDREQPDKSYIEDTMISFGEDGMKGTVKCEENNHDNDFKYVQVQYDSIY